MYFVRESDFRAAKRKKCIITFHKEAGTLIEQLRKLLNQSSCFLVERDDTLLPLSFTSLKSLSLTKYIENIQFYIISRFIIVHN